MAPSLSDREALARWVARGDEDALAQVIRRHGGRVFGVALRGTQGDPLLAEEVAQSVFAVMARKAAALSTHPSLTAWLHRAAVLEASHRRRREAARRRAHTAYADTMSLIHAPEIPHHRPDLDEVLERLPESDRLVVVQRFYEALSFADIAARLGKTEAAVRKQTSRALTKLQTLLRRRGFAVSVAGLTTALTHHAQATLPSSLASSLAAHSAAASTTLTGSHLALHSLALMTYGHKTLLTTVALVLILLSLGGSYSLGLAQARAAHFSQQPPTLSHAVGPPPAPDRGFAKPGATIRAAVSAPDVRATMASIAKGLEYLIATDSHASWPQVEVDLARFTVESLFEARSILQEYRQGTGEGELKRYETLAGVVFAYWAQQDLNAARQALVSADYLRSDGKVSVHALRRIMDQWAEQDPGAAIHWGLALVDEGRVPVETPRGVGASLFPQWFAKDEAAVWQEMSLRLAGQPHLVSDAFANLLRNERFQDDLHERLDSVADPTTRSEAVSLLQNHLRWVSGSTQPDTILDRLKLDAPIREEVRRGL